MGLCCTRCQDGEHISELDTDNSKPHLKKEAFETDTIMTLRTTPNNAAVISHRDGPAEINTFNIKKTESKVSDVESSRVMIDLRSPKSKINDSVFSINSNLKFNPNVVRPDESKNISVISNVPQNHDIKHIQNPLQAQHHVQIKDEPTTKVYEGVQSDEFSKIKTLPVPVPKDSTPEVFEKTKTLIQKSNLNLEVNPEDKINLKDYSMKLFDCINSIRTEPFKYFGKIHKILENTKLDTTNNKYYINFEGFNFTYYFKESLEVLKKADDFLKELTPEDAFKLEDIRHNTFWNEKIHLDCQDHVKHPNEEESVLFGKIAKNYQYECESSRVIIDGLMDSESLALILLMDNLKDRESIFCRSYDVGACASIKTHDERRIRTVLVLVDIIYPGERERRERRSGKDRNLDWKPSTEYITPGPTITLDHPAFDNITYKDEIVDGDFSIEGNLIKAQFVLNNGETKTETFTM